MFPLAAIEVTAASDSTLIVLGFFTLLGTVVSGLFAFLSNKHAKSARIEATQANTAVNHRKAGEPRLVDLVQTIHSDLQGQSISIEVLKTRMDNLMETHAIRHQVLASRVEEINDTLTQRLIAVEPPKKGRG